MSLNDHGAGIYLVRILTIKGNKSVYYHDGSKKVFGSAKDVME